MTKLMILRGSAGLSLLASQREKTNQLRGSNILSHVTGLSLRATGGSAAISSMHCFYSMRLLRHFASRKDTLLGLCERPEGARQSRPCTAFILSDCFVTALLAKTHSLCHCERPKGARQSHPCTAFILSDCFVTAFLAKTHSLVFASDRRERGNLVILNDEIASVVTLPRKDKGGKRLLQSLHSSKDKGGKAIASVVTLLQRQGGGKRLLRSLRSLAKTRGGKRLLRRYTPFSGFQHKADRHRYRFHSFLVKATQAADQSFLRNGQNLFALNKRLLLKAVSRRWINGHMERNRLAFCADSQNNRIRVMGVAICRIRLNDNRQSQAGLFGTPARGPIHIPDIPTPRFFIHLSAWSPTGHRGQIRHLPPPYLPPQV